MNKTKHDFKACAKHRMKFAFVCLLSVDNSQDTVRTTSPQSAPAPFLTITPNFQFPRDAFTIPRPVGSAYQFRGTGLRV
jgi:hypothetical protein